MLRVITMLQLMILQSRVEKSKEKNILYKNRRLKIV
jgi:hypothetical protein